MTWEFDLFSIQNANLLASGDPNANFPAASGFDPRQSHDVHPLAAVLVAALAAATCPFAALPIKAPAPFRAVTVISGQGVRVNLEVCDGQTVATVAGGWIRPFSLPCFPSATD
jgi:hypothetical protein